MNGALGIALYGAGVATLVAARQIFTELPSVKVEASDKVFSVSLREDVFAVVVMNTGRRPITIGFVGYVRKDGMAVMPHVWALGGPFRLEEGESKTLRLAHGNEPADTPPDVIWAARDVVGRWWPRLQRPRLYLRSRRSP